MSKEVSPTLAEIQAQLVKTAKAFPKFARLEQVGLSGQGRPLLAMRLTDPSVRPADKQHVLVAGGQHGNEESGRAVAMALIDWLCRGGRPLLACHEIAVMPLVNPDGAAEETYGTPAGVKPNTDHGPNGPTIPEAAALQKLAYELEPEVYVDLHARGHAGCSYDMVLYPGPQPYTSDDLVLQKLAVEMAAASDRTGIVTVVHPLSWPGWTGNIDLDGPSSTTFHYRQFKSIVLLTENAEHNEFAYCLPHRQAAGLARLKTLLAYGRRRWDGLYYPGYPSGMAVGMFHLGLVAVGKTMAARRASRIAMWRHHAKFDKLGMANPEKLKEKRVILDYSGPELPTGAGIQFRASMKMAVKRVALNGKALRPSETNGYYTWQDRSTTYVVAAMPVLKSGQTVLEVQFR